MYKVNLFSEKQTFLFAKFMKNDKFSQEQIDWQRFVTVPSKKIVCPGYALNIRHLIVSRQGRTKWNSCRLASVRLWKFKDGGPKKQDFCNVVTRFQGFHLIF